MGKLPTCYRLVSDMANKLATSLLCRCNGIWLTTRRIRHNTMDFCHFCPRRGSSNVQRAPFNQSDSSKAWHHFSHHVYLLDTFRI